MADTVMNFRVDQDLKTAFEKVAKARDLTASQMLRHYMRDSVAAFMREGAQGDLLKPTHTKASPKEKKRPKGSVIPSSWRAK